MTTISFKIHVGLLYLSKHCLRDNWSTISALRETADSRSNSNDSVSMQQKQFDEKLGNNYSATVTIVQS
jgi:hypothetical protein